VAGGAHLAGGAVRISALRRMGIVAVAVATPDLTVLLVDDVLGSLTPRRFASRGLRSRLCGKDLAYPDSACAAVGLADAVGDGVNGRLFRHGGPLLEMVPMRRFCLVDVPFAWTTMPITPLRRHWYGQIGRSGDVAAATSSPPITHLSGPPSSCVGRQVPRPLRRGELPDPYHGPDHEVRRRADDVVEATV